MWLDKFLAYKTVRAMPAPGRAAITAIAQILLREHPKTVLDVIVDALDQFAIDHCAPASRNNALRSSGSTATPSRNFTYLPEIAGTRSPGTMKPTRLRGSAAETTSVSPVHGRLRMARSDSTASGK